MSHFRAFHFAILAAVSLASRSAGARGVPFPSGFLTGEAACDKSPKCVSKMQDVARSDWSYSSEEARAVCLGVSSSYLALDQCLAGGKYPAPHAFPAPSREHDLRYAADCAMAGGHTTVGADGNYTDCVKP
jgi:hypothetical protein